MLGLLWILFSDRIVPEYQTLKGIAFVAVTGALIWALLERSWKERLHLEERHRQAQRLESIGRLAGGVAHDFNNLLTAIRGYTDLALAELPEDSPVHQDLQQSQAATERAVALTRQLLAFSRRQTLRPVTIDLNEVVAGTLRMTERLLPSSIEVVTSLSDDLPAVKGDPAQLEQVVMNLLVNARDAVSGGGEIRVESSTVTIETDADHPGAVRMPPGPYALLRVSDDGRGMDAATLDKVFEPFFTTKEGGTGLGLSSCYGIVKQHDGYIFATGEPGRGATFYVYLPASADADEAVAPTPSHEPPTSVAPGGGRVLAIDDDIGVRGVVVRTLQNAGYEVEDTGKPHVALEMLEEEGSTLDLIVTDLVMPGLDGSELIPHIERHCPDAKVLIITGYPGRAASLDTSAYLVIEKPFSPKELLSNVHELLSGDPA